MERSVLLLRSRCVTWLESNSLLSRSWTWKCFYFTLKCYNRYYFSYFHDINCLSTTHRARNTPRKCVLAAKSMKRNHVTNAKSKKIAMSFWLTIRFNCCRHILINRISTIQTCELCAVLCSSERKVNRKLCLTCQIVQWQTLFNNLHVSRPSGHFRFTSHFSHVLSALNLLILMKLVRFWANPQPICLHFQFTKLQGSLS